MHLAEQRHQPATIAATATAVPPHILAREDVKTYMRKVFAIGERRLDAMMTVIDNAQVHQRHSILPIEYIVEPRPLAQTSRDYQEHAVRLGRRAAEACLVNASMTPRDIDMIITVSCTGFMIPSLDAHLINLMGFSSDVRQIPLTELGCAAGSRRPPALTMLCTQTPRGLVAGKLHGHAFGPVRTRLSTPTMPLNSFASNAGSVSMLTCPVAASSVSVCSTFRSGSALRTSTPSYLPAVQYSASTLTPAWRRHALRRDFHFGLCYTYGRRVRPDVVSPPRMISAVPRWALQAARSRRDHQTPSETSREPTRKHRCRQGDF
jgi:hypothetical protein